MTDQTPNTPTPASSTTPAPAQEQIAPAEVPLYKASMEKAGLSPREQQTRLAKHGAAEMPAPVIVDIPGMVPASASEYHASPITLSDGADVTKVFRAGLEAAGMPKEIGSAILADIGRSAEKYKSMDDNGRKIDAAATAAKLREFWKDYSQNPAKLELVKQLVSEIDAKAPGFSDAFTKTGAVNNPRVAINLALHAERVLAVKYGPDGPGAKRERAAAAKRGPSAASIIFQGAKP